MVSDFIALRSQYIIWIRRINEREKYKIYIFVNKWTIVGDECGHRRKKSLQTVDK